MRIGDRSLRLVISFLCSSVAPLGLSSLAYSQDSISGKSVERRSSLASEIRDKHEEMCKDQLRGTEFEPFVTACVNKLEADFDISSYCFFTAMREHGVPIGGKRGGALEQLLLRIASECRARAWQRLMEIDEGSFFSSTPR